MNYESIYKSLCLRGKFRKKERNDGLEAHHIIPVFLYKNNKRNLRYKDGIYPGDGEHIDNITYLTYREHFIAHLLLAKIWKNTKWEYRCYTSLKMFLNGGQINGRRDLFNIGSRKIEYYKKKTNEQLSKGKMKTMPAKILETGERLGIVNIDHPKVLSGEWVHITKGIKKSDEQKQRHSEITSGLLNANSKYSDDELFESYKRCCYHYGKVVNARMWVYYAEKHGLPYIKFFKQFRFGGNGWNGMVDKLITESKKNKKELEIITNYNSKEWREFVKKEKK